MADKKSVDKKRVARALARYSIDEVDGPRYTVVESFSGPGGLSLGLGYAGFLPVHAFDVDAMAVATYRRNIGQHGVVADARDVSAAQISPLLDGELDLFSGGPPCQGFSKQKRGAHLGDDRNELIEEYVRLVKELRPRVFLLENVAIFGQKRGRKYLANLATRLDAYELYPEFYNTADYGLAQTRARFVLVGVRDDLGVVFRKPAATHPTWRTVADVIGHLPEPPEDYSEHPDHPNHQRARVTPINIERFSHVPQGGGWQDIPMDLRLPCHRNADTKSGGWPDVYGRLEWHGQCPTITGGFDSFTRGRYGHPLHDRPLTPHEAALLQGFPDDFRFEGTRGHVRSQIGNAVPPPLAAAIGAEIRRVLLLADGLITEDVMRARDSHQLRLI
jgi:DNA (cytosine-5)-methyltransferase 1